MTDRSDIPGAVGPPPALHGARLLIGSLALALANFMNVLDTSIANVSIRTIAGDFGVSPHQGTWVITAYAVSLAITVPLTGWLTARFGAVRLFVTAIMLFTLSSLLCGTAPTLQSLVVCRVLQGACAGPMMPLSQTLLLSTYPGERRGTALAVWSMPTLVAPVLGPIAGGWISDNLSWPWIFYINIPVGLLAAWVAWTIYREHETPVRKFPVDRVGLLLLFTWVGCLQVMLDKGKDLDWFTSPTIIALACIVVVAFVFFVIWELTDDHPVVDLTLFTRRNFVIGTVSLALGFGVYFGNLVILPIWMQTELGYTATRAGLVLAPVGLVGALLTPLVGRFVDHHDLRWFLTFTHLVFAFALAMRAGYTSQVDFPSLWIPSAIMGLGVATFGVPVISLTLSGLEPARLPAATGLSNFVRLMFLGFGTSIATTTWEHRSSLHYAHLTESVSRFNPALEQSLEASRQGGIPADAALQSVERLVSHQAVMLGTNDIFIVSSVLFVGLAVLVWLAKPRRTRATG